MTLQTGRYTIVNPAFGKVLGTNPTKPTVRPVLAIADVGTEYEPTFFIERLDELGPLGLPIYRIMLENYFVTVAYDQVVVDAASSPQDATVWIIQPQGGDTYGLVQGYTDEPVKPLAWTLRNNIIKERVSLNLVSRGKGIAPLYRLKDGQVFKLTRELTE